MKSEYGTVWYIMVEFLFFVFYLEGKKGGNLLSILSKYDQDITPSGEHPLETTFAEVSSEMDNFGVHTQSYYVPVRHVSEVKIQSKLVHLGPKFNQNWSIWGRKFNQNWSIWGRIFWMG